MRKLSSFTSITLDGYYKGTNEDISWHMHEGEAAEFASASSQSGNALLFGRVTYEMMESFWPTPAAYEAFPVIADGMNKSEKFVFSTTLKKTGWNNTTIIKDNIIDSIRKLKESKGSDLTILGSGSIITQLAAHRLIDEFQVMIDPVIIGEGTPIFKGIGNRRELELISSRVFNNGVILVNYRPADK